MMSRKVAGLAGAVLLAAAGMGTLMLLHQQAPEEGMKAITIEVIHKDGSKKSWTLETDDTALKSVLLDEGLIEGEEGAFGLFVTAVDGETADYDQDQAYWRLQVDGTDSTSGVDETLLSDQSVYTWIYTPAAQTGNE